MTKELSTKTLVVSLHVTRWGNRKHSKEASNKIAEESNADPSMLSTTKRLINPELLKPIDQVYREAINFHTNETLAWMGFGTRVIPTTKFFEWSTEMQGLADQFYKAVDTFVKEYETKIKEAEKQLGSMFNKADYPTAQEMRSRFSFKTDVAQVASTGDFRVDLPKAQFDEVVAKLEETMSDASSKAIDDLYKRTEKVLNRLHATLVDEDQKVYKSTVKDNVDKLIRSLKELNYTYDVGVNVLYQFIEKNLKGLDPEIIKSSNTYRKNALELTNKALETLKTYYKT